MGRTSLRIAGHAPKYRWKRNVGRKKRTIEEAIIIAKMHGLEIPDDVEFVEADPGDLEGSFKEFDSMETARVGSVTEQTDGFVYWDHHYVPTRKKIVIRVHPEVLSGDECIIGVFAHELYELSELRDVFMASPLRRMNASDYGGQVAPRIKRNFHYQAWDYADQQVLEYGTKKLKGFKKETE